MMSFRSIYIAALSPEVFLDSENIISVFGIHDSDAEISSTENIRGKLGNLKKRSSADFQRIYKAINSAPAEDRDRICDSILSQTAPLASSFGMTLQGLSAPAVFEDPVSLKLLQIHADDIGVGKINASRFNRYCDLLMERGLSGQALSRDNIGLDRNIRDCFFEIPAMIYALSRRSDRFAPELLGVDLCLRTIGMMPFWKSVFDFIDFKTGTWQCFDLSTPQHLNDLMGKKLGEYLLDTIDPILNEKDKALRISATIDLFSAKLSSYCENICGLIEIYKSPRLEMALLIQDKARDGSIYHGNYEIEGCPLKDWLSKSLDDPLPLVDALSKSKLISPGNPDKSVLPKLSESVHSKMFRIFNQTELDIMKRWIESLGDDQGETRKGRGQQRETEDHIPKSLYIDFPEYKEITAGDMSLGTTPTNIRQAYAALLGRALCPQIRQFAENYINHWLKLAEDSVDIEKRSLPRTWQIGKLREWLRSSHEQQGYEFDNSKKGDFPTREQVIDQTLQLAPLTMIDGSWLQGFTEPGLASTDYGAPLFETYWDELGNGDWNINHPKIYRDVLLEMGKDVGAIDSVDFYENEEIRNSSFYLSVFWLAIGKFPVKYTAEILGLNLAMELSGVGGSYRSAHKFLKHYGFPTIFVDLHNSIDNVSTGHSAWAADAIDAFILRARSNRLDINDIWRRVRTGYESLAPIVKDQAELNYFGKRKIRTLMKNSKPERHPDHADHASSERKLSS
jgi:hypothetical protein